MEGLLSTTSRWKSKLGSILLSKISTGASLNPSNPQGVRMSICLNHTFTISDWSLVIYSYTLRYQIKKKTLRRPKNSPLFLYELFEAYESTLTDLKRAIKEKEFTRKINIFNKFVRGEQTFIFIQLYYNTIKHWRTQAQHFQVLDFKP